METQQIVKRGKGRPKNSVCFTNITLAELNAKFGPDQILPIGRIFLEKGQIVANKPEEPKIQTIQLAGPTVEFTLSA